MHHSCVGVRMINRHVRLAAAVAEARHGAELVVSNHALIYPGSIHRPSINVGEPVRRGEFHGINNPAVVPYLNTGICPPIETVTGVTAVVQNRFLLEIVPPGTELQLDAPLHAIGPIYIADPYRSAPVSVACGSEIHG